MIRAKRLSAQTRLLSTNQPARVKKTNPTVKKLTTPLENCDFSRIRNVGIIAHVDAGKTTTTERLLYYSGMTEEVGSVDAGTTVTDYMKQERERGITIQSAAISTIWRNHRVNIIDTPGHIDFTMEVERSLSVLDGAVGVLDSSAGVEAQTRTVWHQANRFGIPRLIFLNKMDKRGADVSECLESVQQQLSALPLLTQLNVGLEKDFVGVVDLLTMNKMVWSSGDPRQGQLDYEVTPLSASDGGSLYGPACDARRKLIDDLANVCPDMMSQVMNCVSYDDITAETIAHSLRSVTRANLAVPVLLGSSLRSRGLQPLLDSIIDYLPDPSLNPAGTDQELCALAFKTIHEKERGAVTFLRLFGGTLKGSSSVYNTNQSVSEKVGKLYTILANQLVEVNSIQAGNIAAVTGLTDTLTGDVLLTNSRAQDKLDKMGVVLPSLTVPAPVFMCSVEPYSSSEQKKLGSALECLVKEDPSFRVRTDPETDELVVSGMGELHIEIIRDRLLTEYGLQVTLGPIQVAYREEITGPSDRVSVDVNRVIGEVLNHVTVSVSVHPGDRQPRPPVYVRSAETTWERLNWRHKKALDHGVKLALSSGPLLGYPVVGCGVEIHDFKLHSSRTSGAVISAAVVEAVHAAMRQSQLVLSEPVMRLDILCPQECTGEVLNDLSQRRTIIGEVAGAEDMVAIRCTAPVAGLVGYSTALRKISSGKANFTMEIDGYLTMTQLRTEAIVNERRGLNSAAFV